MRLTSLPRYLRPLLKHELHPAGWRWRFTGGDHVRLTSPEGAIVVASRTPGKPEQVAKLVAAECRRAERKAG